MATYQEAGQGMTMLQSTETMVQLATQNMASKDYSQDILQANQHRIMARFVILGIIIPFGVFFNTVTFIVFMISPSLRRTTTGRYLIALAVADTTYLIGEFLTWLNTPDTKGYILSLNFTNTMYFWCCTKYVLRYYGQFVSSWITVALTTERFFVAAFPLRVGRISTKTTTTLVILLIYGVGFILTAFPFWTMNIFHNEMRNYDFCTFKDKDTFDIWVWLIIRIGSLILPCGLIFVLTGYIVHNLRRLSKARREMASTSGNTSVEKQLSFMFIMVAITTLILRLPYSIFYFFYIERFKIWGDEIRGTWLDFRVHLTNDVLYCIAAINYTINFFLFCMSGTIFRKSLVRCMRCQSADKPSRQPGNYTRSTRATSLMSNSRTNSNTSVNRIHNQNIPLCNNVPTDSPVISRYKHKPTNV